MTSKVPSYFEVGTNAAGDDQVTITLKKGIKTGGDKVMKLVMREPSVGDNLVARDQGNKDDAKFECHLIANLCEIPVEDVHNLKMVDYGRAQEAITFLTG